MGGGVIQFFPVLGGDGMEIAPPWDIFGQHACERSSIGSKLANHVEDHVVLIPLGAVLVISPGTESSNPPTPQSSNDSQIEKNAFESPPGSVRFLLRRGVAMRHHSSCLSTASRRLFRHARQGERIFMGCR